MKQPLIFLFCFSSLFASGQLDGFVQNKGQWESSILFKATLPGGELLLEKDRVRYFFYDTKTWATIVQHPHQQHEAIRPDSLKFHAVQIKMERSRCNRVEPVDPLPGYLNFFLGNNKNRWAGHVPHYAGVVYRSLWPGIDMHWQWQGNRYKYSFVVAAGANPAQIQLAILGAEKLELAGGRLQISTSVNTLEEDVPVAWYTTGTHTRNVPVAFCLKQNRLSFLVGKYPAGYGLTIDPVLVFSTYSGSSVDNFGFTAAYDRRGCLFAGGIASIPTKFPNGTYPVTTGAFQLKMGGGNANGWEGFPCDVSISKYSPNGDSLLWATYLGGSDNEFPHSIIGDKNDELVLFGSTFSVDFPVSASGFDTTANGNYDIFCTRLSSDGSSLLGSTYAGGSGDDGFNLGGKLRYNYADEFRGEVDLDSFGNIYIASCTRSSDFPVSANAAASFSGVLDGLILRFDPLLSKLHYGSYFGGSGEDALYSVEIARNGSVYVGGGTESQSLPTHAGSLNPGPLGGRADGYIARLTNDSFRVMGGTYIGTAAYNQVYFIELDTLDRVYTTGQTEGTFPLKGNVFSEANSGQFIQRLSPGLDTLQLSTVFGLKNGKPNLNPSAFMVDYCGNVYFSGWGSSVQAYVQDLAGTTTGMAITPDAVQDSTDGEDFYILVLSKNMASRLYATYFGAKSGVQEGGDHVDGGTSRFDPQGVVYQSVCSSCPNNNQSKLSNFPTSANAVFKSNISPRCSNASFKIDLKIGNNVKAAFKADTICLPASHRFTNNSTGGRQFLWNFGDGSTDTTRNPSHQYIQPGSYTVSLRVIDSNSCNVADSISHPVLVLGVMQLDFSWRNDPCEALTHFKALSPYATTYYWQFGDGSSDSSSATPAHFYAKKGTYPTTLTVNRGSSCQRSITHEVDADRLDTVSLYENNTFTPDGDGLNDSFCIAPIDTVCTQFHIWIYNRWGQIVYESTNPAHCWPGHDPDGIEHPTGTYYYVLRLTRSNGLVKKLSGNITLLRSQ